jgi:hypothetical protein
MEESRVPEIEIRPPRAGDGADLARVHIESCRYDERLDPEAVQVPDSGGLPDSFDAWARRDPDADVLRLVAVVEGTAIGWITAHLEQPYPRP